MLTEPEEGLAIVELNLALTVANIYEETGVAPMRLSAERPPEAGPNDSRAGE